jgi:hypothetical protein
VRAKAIFLVNPKPIGEFESLSQLLEQRDNVFADVRKALSL